MQRVFFLFLFFWNDFMEFWFTKIYEYMKFKAWFWIWYICFEKLEKIVEPMKLIFAIIVLIALMGGRDPIEWFKFPKLNKSIQEFQNDIKHFKMSSKKHKHKHKRKNKHKNKHKRNHKHKQFKIL